MTARFLLPALMSCAAASAGDWQSLEDHPRPDWARPWINLNGEWRFDFDPLDAELKEAWFNQHSFSKKITAPFPWQSKLSGIQDTEYNGAAWYEREIAVPADAGQRVVLTFGAVDWSATVWVNGKEVASHEGGYVPFSADITGAVKPGENARITVRAVDNTESDLPTANRLAGTRGPAASGRPSISNHAPSRKSYLPNISTSTRDKRYSMFRFRSRRRAATRSP